MKKLVTIALLCAMLLSCFAGCGMKQEQTDLIADVSNINVENAGYTAPTVGTGADQVEYALRTELDTDPSKVASDTGDADITWYAKAKTDGVYILNTVAELKGFFKLRNTDNDGKDAGTTFENITIKLGKDMKVNGTTTVIASTKVFKGTFDGQGHVISGMRLESAGSAMRGFFGAAAGEACVKNVSLVDCSLYVNSVGSKYDKKTDTFAANGNKNTAGSIFSQVATDGSNVTIDNVYSDTDIYFISATPVYTVDSDDTNKYVATSATVKSVQYVAGFVGQVTKGTCTIKNCVYAGDLATNARNVGGFVGGLSGAANLAIDNCKNEGTMTRVDEAYVGGKDSVHLTNTLDAANSPLAISDAGSSYDGQTYYPSTDKVSIAYATKWGGILGYSASTGKIGIADCTSTANIDLAQSYVAGTAAHIENAAEVKIENCENSGSISSTTTHAAGILANFSGTGAITVTGCTNAGDISSTKTHAAGILAQTEATGDVKIENCVNSGSISSVTSHAAGILAQTGATGDLEIKNCSVSGKIVSTGSNTAGIVGQISKTPNFIMDNCHVLKGTEVKADTISGGMVAYIIDIKTTEITNCSFAGTFTGDRSSGGVIGYYDNDYTVVTEGQSFLVENCDVTADAVLNFEIANKTNPTVGGIVGRVRGASMTMKDCDFAGKLNVTFTAAEKDVSQKMAAGGLIGILFDDAGAQSPVATGSVTNCTVTGTLRFLDNTDALCTGAIFVGGTANYTADTTNITYSGLTCAGVTVDTSAIKKGEKGTPMQALQNGNGPTVVGFQLRDAYAPEGSEEGAAKTLYDIRYVAVLNDIDTAKAAGFKVTLIYKDAEGNKVVKVQDQIVYAKNVYETIKGEKASYTAASFQGDYLVTLVIEGIDVNYTTKAGTLEVLLTPFTATDADNINYGMTADHGKIVVAEPAA